MLFWLVIVLLNAVFLAFHIDQGAALRAGIDGLVVGAAFTALLYEWDGGV